MKINIETEKKENYYIKPFIKFYYLSELKLSKPEVFVKTPDRNNIEKAPDYFIPDLDMAIEIKEVHDRKDLEDRFATHRSIKKLQSEIDNLVKNDKSMNYLFFLEYPWSLRISNNKVKQIAQIIVNEIKNGKKEICIKKVGYFRVTHKQEEQCFNIILGSSHSSVMTIDATGTILENIADKIVKADKQLGFTKKTQKKILLLVNKYFWGNETNYFFKALAKLHKELLSYKNIDEIWLQIEKSNSTFYHELLYRRDFLELLDKGLINETYSKLYEKWFSSIYYLEDEYREKLFLSLKNLLRNKKPCELFSNEDVRKQMVELGIWLSDKKRFNDVIWIIEKFIDDPDPEEPEKYKGDPQFNYHEKIIKGEGTIIITTVLGRLAWVIQKLATDKKHISKALDYTIILLSHKNLYIKFQAIVPLIEIAARRSWLKGWGKRPRSSEYKKFHDAVFSIVNLIRNNPNYKALANRLCRVFMYYKDLSTAETELVLDSLKITEESAILFVYFGIFREKHYLNQNIKYDGNIIQKKLKELLESKNYEDLKSKIVWWLWKITDENLKNFKNIKPYIEIILRQEYQKKVYDNLKFLIYELIDKKPKETSEWYKKMLSQIDKYAENKKLQIWLIYDEKIISSIAKYNPSDLYDTIEKIVFLWKKGVFIGNVKNIFGYYKLILDEEKKNKTREQLKKLYSSLDKHSHDIIGNIAWD